MEKTFQDSIPKNDAERQQQNAERAQQGEPQIPGAAGRESVASKDPKGKPSTPLSFCERSRAKTDLVFWCGIQSSTPEAVPVPKATSLSKTPSCNLTTINPNRSQLHPPTHQQPSHQPRLWHTPLYTMQNL